MLVCVQEPDGKDCVPKKALSYLAEGLGLVVVDFTEETRKLGSS